ncbi:hypothetical protein CVD28_02340 [Bacillus sp. M6-12]|uniref:hypothetical protein n=1 Tax=Bacillus sp. M6-12 TaxID=2054166 RepID=UPI000C78736D|nr:hypothetical protein [Bacillus sp. M6-12]PLS19272.1 hypothetical protein CVD28_02340 [Bacillus sp. M6-12]
MSRSTFHKELEQKDTILNLYYREKESMSKISKKLNIYTKHIKKILMEYGQGLRSKQEQGKINYQNFSEDSIKRIRHGAVTNRYTEEYGKKLSITQTGKSNNQSKLTEQDVINIRKEYEEALSVGKQKVSTQEILAEKYHVKRPTISDIVRGATWKHLL